MKKEILFCLALILFIAAPFSSLAGATSSNESVKDSTEISKDDKLVIVWTSGDKEVAMRMVFLYAYNAKKNNWWKDVTLLIWGPSAKLLVSDKDLQEYLKKLQDKGVETLACKGCADQYNVGDELTKLGVTVRYTGVDLTNFIKERHVITF